MPDQTILIVDDEPQIRRVMRTTLTSHGYSVVEAKSGDEALSLIRTPFAARETFSDSVVGREARNIADLLSDGAKCAMVAVTTAEALAMAETLELNRTLAALEIDTPATFFNRTSPAAFEAADVARMIRRGSRTSGLQHLEALADIARAELQRRTRERRALAILRRQFGGEVIEIEDCRRLSGVALTMRLAEQMQ